LELIDRIAALQSTRRLPAMLQQDAPIVASDVAALLRANGLIAAP